MEINPRRQLVIFNPKGDKVAMVTVPELIYLQTEKEWIDKCLYHSQLNGMAFVIDWEERKLASIRYAENN